MNAPDIRFPNIWPGGINIQKLDSEAFSLFGLSIKWYGVLIGIAVLTGLLVALREARKSGQDKELYYNYFFVAVISCIIGARLYYVIFSWSEYKDNLLKIFAFREGGLAIYGAVIAGIISAKIYTKVKKYNFWLFADTGVFGLIMGQAIGRYGNFINREAFGGKTSSIFAMQYKLSTVRGVSSDLIEQLKVTVPQFNTEYIQVHPTFLYESMWNVTLFIFLQIYKKHKKFTGEIFLLYLFGYGIGRFWIEGLRTDQLKLFGSGLAVSQVLSVVLVIFSGALIFYKRNFQKNN